MSSLYKIVLVLTWLSVSAMAQTVSPFVSGVWCGNVSPTAASVVVRLTNAGQRVRLAVSKNAGLGAPAFSPLVTTAAPAGNTLTLTMQGLEPDTDYFYGIEVAGQLRAEENSRGRFHTFPLGRGSFKIAFASCSDYRLTNQSAFQAILAERPLLFIHMGDLHYNDTNTTNIEDYRANYDAVLNSPAQSALYRNIPLAYMWDDHDFCGNDSNGTFAGRDTARLAYRERTPHYPIAAAGGAVAQSFTVGRVRIIMTDLRSASSPPDQKETATKTRMGAAQKAWFKQELITARDANFPLILWVCTDPWIAAPELGDDTWAGHATERIEIANFIRDNHVTNVVLLCGDMHGLAYDDGTHSDYATGGGAPLTVLHAASLTSPGAPKGGPYTGGPIADSQQFGLLEVYDTGGPSIACRFLGVKVGEGTRLSHIFSTANAASTGDALVNISTLAHLSGPDDVVVSGFVLSGRGTRAVLVRAAGPALTDFGLNDALLRPKLEVYQGGRLIATNIGWAPSAEAAATLGDAFDRAGAFQFRDASSRDAALLLNLEPGAYTVKVSSADKTPGSTMLEVYDLR